ncbi:MAG: type II toxin-antitoxin system VapC family toxin [Chloroflexi bacterium]|nr:type II toxin-antitoxin system VapC family toxin [Chloroflexota bacterium]MBU1748527.1 type II toxin-antitoxin system VapC family toxin [Chloroflexota bacterium]
MKPLVCADASLALKIVLPESDSARARALWDEWQVQRTLVIAPTLWGYEVTSVIRNRVHRGKLAPDLERDVFVAVHQLPVQMLAPAGLHQRAWELAQQFNRPAAYDAHYLALAEMAGCDFWTADERLFNTVQADLGWVYWLGAYQPAVEVGSGH